MGNKSLKSETLSGLVWSILERFSVQGVQFLIMLVIARILNPRDYGMIGMLSIFLVVSAALVDSGFAQALIRKQNRTDIDCSTVLYFNIFVGVFLYLVLFEGSPLIATFFDEPLLEPLMKVLGLVLVINSLSVVQRALLTAEMDFKSQAVVSFVSATLSGLVGIYLACNGYQVWALVYSSIISSVVNTSGLWFCSKWRPRLCFSRESFCSMFPFGSKLMVSGIIDALYNNLYPFIIGKFFSASYLGYYTRAKNFSDLPSSNLTGIMQKVTYPILCKLQDDDNDIIKIYRRFLKSSAFVVFPLMCLLAGISHPLITILIGKKWDFAATLLIPLCFGMMFHPIHALNLNILQVKGRSDLFLKLEIYKKSIGLLLIFISVPFGIMAMCYMCIVLSIICLFINTYYTGKLYNLGVGVQFRDLLPTLMMSILIFASSYLTTLLFSNSILQLLFGTCIGIFGWVCISCIFRFEEVDLLKSLIKK